MRQREVHLEAAAHGAPHRHDRFVNPEMVKQADQVTHVAELALDRLALSVSAHVVADDTEVPGEPGKFVVPLTAVGDAGMDHDQRKPATGHLIVEAGVSDWGKPR